jgi:ribosomal protein L16 Arg81 hydroxylase
MSILPRKEPDSTFDMTLDDLITPVSIERFLNEFWGKSILVATHSTGFFRQLLSLSDIDACLMTAANSSGNILHVIASQGSSRSTTLTTVGAIPKGDLYNAFLSGDTIRLIGVEKFWPPVNSLIIALQDALDTSAGVNFFLTPAHSQAFPLHFDNTDAFIIQLEGSKRWQIWGPTYENPIDSDLSQRYVLTRMEKDETKLKLLEDIVLESGDVLYLPRGFYHKALAQDELSLHLTVSLHPLSWLDFFKQALELAALEEPELRESLPPRFIRSQHAQPSMRATFERMLKGFLGNVSFEGTLRAVVNEQVGNRVPPPDHHFAVLSDLSRVGVTSWIERRKGLACLVEEVGEKAMIRFGTQRVQGPRILLPTLEFIRDHERFRVTDLPGSTALDGKLTLVRRLVREGLLRTLDL